MLNGKEEYQPPELVKVERADEAERKSFQLEGSGIWLKLTCDHVKNCFLVYSAVGKDSGFTLTDSEGEVEILHIRGNRENKIIFIWNWHEKWRMKQSFPLYGRQIRLNSHQWTK